MYEKLESKSFISQSSKHASPRPWATQTATLHLWHVKQEWNRQRVKVRGDTGRNVSTEKYRTEGSVDGLKAMPACHPRVPGGVWTLRYVFINTSSKYQGGQLARSLGFFWSDTDTQPWRVRYLFYLFIHCHRTVKNIVKHFLGSVGQAWG